MFHADLKVLLGNFFVMCWIFNGICGKIISGSYWLLWCDICGNRIILAI